MNIQFIQAMSSLPFAGSLTGLLSLVPTAAAAESCVAYKGKALQRGTNLINLSALNIQRFTTLLRPMRPSREATAARSDQAYLAVLDDWLRRIRLAGNVHDLRGKVSEIYQAPSPSIGINTYMLVVNDAATLRQICINSKQITRTVREEYGPNLGSLDYKFGVITLNRGIWFDARAGEVSAVNIEEWYSMVVWATECRVLTPLFRAYHDSLGFFYSKPRRWRPEIANAKLNAVPRFYFDSDVVILPYHTFARSFGIARELPYLRVKSAAWARTDASVHGVYGGEPVSARMHTTIYLKNQTAQGYERDFSAGISSFAPPYDVKVVGRDTAVVTNEIPEHPYPEGAVEASLFAQYLQQKFGGGASYIGNGLIAVVIPSVLVSAVANGTRSSPWGISAKIGGAIATTATGPIGGLSYGAGTGAGVAVRNISYYSKDRKDRRREEIPAQQAQCLSATSTYGDCVDCLNDGAVGAELSDMRGDGWKAAGAAVASGAGFGCVAGAIGAAFSLGVTLAAGCIAGALAGLLAAGCTWFDNYMAMQEAEDKYYSSCEANIR